MTGQPDDGDQDGRERRDKPDPASPGSDILGEFQRWFIRSSAKNMRKEFGGQVRKTLGGGRGNAGDIWDTATTEVPAPDGEAPECQWCPICRAARRMRESNPGLSGQISGAGDAVAAAVQDAIKAFDSLLGRTAGTAGTASTAGQRSSGERSGGEHPGGERPGGEPREGVWREAEQGRAEESDAEQPGGAPGETGQGD
jgi:hypothetical protein